MNDFFTELDSDLLNINKAPNIQKKPVVEGGEHSSNIGDVYKTPTTPVQKKLEIKPELKVIHEKPEVRERRETQEESRSNFSITDAVVGIFPESKPQFLPTLPKGQTRVITIGGQNEVGKNMSMCQYEDEILLLDGGIQFPENDMLGAKYSLPDISFLFPMKQKIMGIVITSGLENNIGGLKHILPALGYPKVYGTKLTIGMIKRHLSDAGILQKVNLRVVNPDTDGILEISPNLKIELFRQDYSIPDAVGVYIETPNAKLVHTGDFKFDSIPSIDKRGDVTKLEQIGARGIDLLMSDSINSMKEGFSKTEAEIGAELHQIISKTEGRIIIAISASLIGRIGQIIESAEKTGRTVFLNGRGIMENVNLGRTLGCISNSYSVKSLTSKIDSIPDNNQIILTTGSQGEEGSGLYRMAYGEHPIVKIRLGDTVILSSTPVPENERREANIINALIRLWATLFTKDGLDTYVSGHGAKEEQKIMLDLIHPRNFMPIHGELFMRVAHKKTVMTVGFLDKNIFLTDNGSILDIDQNGNITKNKFRLILEEIIVDGHGIGIATSHVIEARAQMMKSWVVTIIFKADEKTKTLLGHLKLETRGFVYLDEVRMVHKMIIKKARASYEDTMKDIPDIEEKDLIKIIRRDLEIFLLSKIERNPVIIPMIILV